MHPHIQAMTVREFKGIAQLDLALDESLTLLVGVNGVGKTSVIEALLGAVTKLWNWLAPAEQEKWFKPPGDLVRFGARESKITSEVVFQDSFRANCDVSVKANKFKLSGRSKNVLFELKNKPSPLPLVVYYDQNRIGGSRSEEYRIFSETNREAALNTTPYTLSDFKKWFFEKESDEALEAVERRDLEYADPEVQAVREVLKSIVGDSAVLRSRKPDGSMGPKAIPPE